MTATPICSKHRVPKEWKPTTFEYNDDDISIRVPDVYAWVCPESNEASFPPETVDELITTVRDLLAATKQARDRRSVLRQYVISVGQPEGDLATKKAA